MTVDHPFRSPSSLRRIRQTDQGARLHVDTEDHDLGLLRSIADAVATDDEAVALLTRYSEAMAERDRAEKYDDQREVARAEREANELRDEIDALLEGDQSPGEGQVVVLNESQVVELAAVSTRIVAEHVTAEEGDAA